MLTKSIQFIKYQLDRAIKVQRKQAARGVPTTLLDAIIVQFEETLASMSAAQERLKNSIPDEQRDRTVLTPADVADLPQELIKQLSLSEGDFQEFEIHRVMVECGGIMSLDHILIELFKRKGEIQERTKLNARLYRMVQKGLIFDVPRRRGVYTVIPNAPSTSLSGDLLEGDTRQQEG